MTVRSVPSQPSSNGHSKPTPGSGAEPAIRQRSPAADVLQQQLVQKDELIQALTSQLEQAAEQLDRLHRTGADRRRAGIGGGVPQDLVDDQRRTLEDLQRVVQQWEDMQAGLTLGRLEIQLEEIRDLIVQGAGTHHESVRLRDNGEHVHSEPVEIPERNRSHEAAAPQDTAWEQLKSQLLAGDDAPADVTNWSPAEEPLAPLPEPLPPETSDCELLRQAVQRRDEYISLLLSRLRSLEVLQPAAALAALDAAAPELTERIVQLEERLQEHLRCAEVELSVERAKLARERAHLAQQAEQLERQLKKLGLSSVDEIDPAIGPAVNSQERRWARFLGRPKGE